MTAYAERAPGGPDRGQGPLAAAFAVALLLHLLALAGLAYMRLTPTETAGEQQISIDLTPQMEEALPQEALEAAPQVPDPDEVKPEGEPTTANPVETQEAPVPPPPPPETAEVRPEEATPPPPAEMTQVMPEEVTPPPPPPEAVAEAPPDAPPPPPEEQVITSQAQEAEPLAPPPPVVAKPPEPPKPVKEAKPKPKEPDPAKIAAEREARRQEILEKKREAEREARRRELVDAKREEQRKAAAKAKAERDAARRATENAQGAAQRNQRESALQRSGGGDPNALAAWKGQLSSTIRGRMNRGAAAGTAGGSAVVRFTVSRSGAVSGAALVSSSGVPAIDAAALAAVRGSLPPAPAGFTQPSLSVTVPMRFGGT